MHAATHTAKIATRAAARASTANAERLRRVKLGNAGPRGGGGGSERINTESPFSRFYQAATSEDGSGHGARPGHTLETQQKRVIVRAFLWTAVSGAMSTASSYVSIKSWEIPVCGARVHFLGIFADRVCAGRAVACR